MKKKMCWTVITVVLALTLTACVQTTAPESPEPTAPPALAGQPTATPCVMSVAEEPPEWPGSFEEAASQAELIVLADVVSLEQGPDVVQDPAYPDYRMPTQLTTTQVVKAYKGTVTPGQRLILYQSGIGIVTDLSSPLWSDDVRQCDKMRIIRGNEPYYQPGERYVLALTPVVLSEEEKGLQPEPLPEGMVRTLWRGRLLINQDGTVTSVVTDAAGRAAPEDTVGETLEEIETLISDGTG